MSSCTWIHCNKCCNFEETSFYVTKCAHVLCTNCSERCRDIKICPVCKTQSTSFMPLNKNAPSSVVQHFKSSFLKEFVQVKEYQDQQWDNYLASEKAKFSHNKQEFMHLRKRYEEEKEKTSRLTKKLESMRMENGRPGYQARGSGILNATPMNDSDSRIHFSMQSTSSRNMRENPTVHAQRSISSIMSDSSENRGPRYSDHILKYTKKM